MSSMLKIPFRLPPSFRPLKATTSCRAFKAVAPSAPREIMNVSILTWNLANNDLHATAKYSLATKLTAIVNEVHIHSPDVLALQESTISPTAWEHLGYQKFGDCKSHAPGLVELFIRNNPLVKVEAFRVDKFPAAILRHQETGNPILGVASLHLEPYSHGFEDRLHQLHSIAEDAASITRNQPFVFAGDLNMREKETAHAGQVLSAKDAYDDWALRNATEAMNTKKFSWDSVANEFYRNGAKFTCRFDRFFARGPIECENFQMVGCVPPGGGDAYLSNHFGLLAKFRLP
ncbi:Endonuclease/exonuclease/phosphatase [Powellomyces hirtus]|nr:Endonuclease/exonuclease/phosphatase [Powellomyces hirtus]